MILCVFERKITVTYLPVLSQIKTKIQGRVEFWPVWLLIECWPFATFHAYLVYLQWLHVFWACEAHQIHVLTPHEHVIHKIRVRPKISLILRHMEVCWSLMVRKTLRTASLAQLVTLFLSANDDSKTPKGYSVCKPLWDSVNSSAPRVQNSPSTEVPVVWRSTCTKPDFSGCECAFTLLKRCLHRKGTFSLDWRHFW